MTTTIFQFIVWFGFLYIMIVDYQTLKKNQKLKKELQDLFKQLDEDVNLYHRKSQLAGFTVKKVNLLHEHLQKEQSKMKETNRFINQAIKEKVNKKKIRGKRRRKTA